MTEITARTMAEVAAGTTAEPTVDPAAQPADVVDEAEALQLGRDLQDCAAQQARVDHAFCELIDRFDRSEALRWFHGITSVAHYVSWACSMSGGAAREHVRVARGLRLMPTVKRLFAEGRFSYSKVRELTRVAGVVDEEKLCQLALEMTASQTARTVAAYRLAPGNRIRAERRRRLSWSGGDDGMTRLSVVLATEEAALLKAAIELSLDRLREQAREPQAHPDPTVDELGPDRVQALLDVASTYLTTSGPSAPEDDNTLVVVQISADQLDHNVPAGTPPGSSGISQVQGGGPIEAATAQRLTCTARLVGAIIDRQGEVLTLGRTRRLASRTQRRALKLRDKGICQFPGCHRTAHLDAHHLTPWSRGGPTDLDNLMLLCRRHHVCVHEGGLQVRRVEGERRFEFTMPDGQPITHRWSRQPRRLPVLMEDLAIHAEECAAERRPRVFPPSSGAGFSLDECVRVLFAIEAPPPVELAA